MTSLKTSIKTITYLSDTGCLEIQGASLEGDLSLEYWQREHQRFFTCEGYFSDDMELIMEEFEVVDVL